MLPVRFDEIRGRRLRYARLGEGSPVVLLHGYPDNLLVWSEVAPLLAADHTVVALDWPGMGASESWTGGATPFHMADHLLALLDHWKIGRAAIVGLDMGGQPALVFAAHYPQRATHVVVSGSLLQWDAPTSWEIRLLRRFRFNQLFLRHFPQVVFHRALATFLPRGVDLSPEIRSDFWDHFRRAEVREFIVRMCAGYQGTLPKLPDEYRKVSAPTLALWGRRDSHFPPSHATRLQQQVPGAQVHLIEGGEHWLPLHQPDAFANAVHAFVTKSPLAAEKKR